MNYPSRIIERAVNSFSRFPGIGKKTALRLVIHLINASKEEAEELAAVSKELHTDLKKCKQCHNVSDHEFCAICADKSRDQSLICVVEDLRDVMAIENTGQYFGLYHVLGGLIAPLDGKGPDDLQIQSLIDRVNESHISEIIMALSATMEGDTTVFYLSRKLAPCGIKISAISRGIAVGGELEYADEITLARSIQNRTPYSSN